MKHLFLDTCILIDVLANREPHADPAAKLLAYADNGKLNLYMSALSFSHMYYVLRKACSHKEMIALLKDMKAIARTLDVTDDIISKALESGMKDFEDAIQLHTALSQKKMQAIVTRDRKGFKESEIAVLTPEEAWRMATGAGGL
jgi:predicted nucleic acid-binding protein